MQLLRLKLLQTTLLFKSVQRSVHTVMSALPPSSCAMAIANHFPAGWRPASSHYAYAPHPTAKSFVVPITTIEPPRRERGVADFDPDRLNALARCIAEGIPLPPIAVGAPALSQPYLLRVSDGYHRFYLSRELGFTQVPAYFVADM